MMFNDRTATWAFGVGILVGITIGSFVILIRQENVAHINKPMGRVPGTADGLTMATSNWTSLPIIDLMNELVYAKDTNMNNPSQFAYEIMQIFSKKKNGGFFIEAGANDGEFLSNTLQLEREYNWTGLLIETNPFMLTKLLLTNRKAWIANVCLSLEGYPQKVRFLHFHRPQWSTELWRDGLGIIEHSASNPEPPQTHRDPKLYVYAKVFSIESNLIPEGREVLKAFLKSKGYKFLFERLEVESFFIHEDFTKEFDIPSEQSFRN